MADTILVGELKERLKDIPDDYEVYWEYAFVGNTSNCDFITDIEIDDILKSVVLKRKGN